MAKLLFYGLSSAFKSRRRLLLENTLLRYQIQVLKRRKRRLSFKLWDRAILVWFSKRLPDWKRFLTIVEPETIIRWHRKGFALYWAWKHSSKAGRNPIDPNAIDLIQEISRKNPLWGVPRIHGELLKLGITACERTVDKYRYRRRRPSGQNWRTFLKNHLNETVAIDFFIVPTVRFKMLWALVVLSHDRREILHTAVTRRPSAPWTLQQLRETFSYRDFPKFLLHDRDRHFLGLHRSGMREVITSYRSPWQNAYVERVIGSIRRECTDHIIPFNEEHLAKILGEFTEYYNRSRTHLSLSKDSPNGREMQRLGEIVVTPRVGGLHNEFSRSAA